MFGKILIANRGEIACRVIATARRVGVATVAVYSEADADARHVRLADEAWPIGLAPSRQSYLQGETILGVARRSGAEAIHPGYGFLSENADFAAACAAASVTFIGPPEAAIRAMGSKAESKRLMARCGVPLAPGYHGESQDFALLLREASEIGYPLLIKASAGGGGRGMRVVLAAEEFKAALDSAKREALASFGDDRVLIEKYLTAPRHIEIQVFGDSHGNCVSLFERDCSIQRRHQKVLEEAPAPGMSANRRNAIGEAAIAAARAVGYVGAGTVEFIAEGDAFYFMEMNTRLQVEHPVTEMVTGVDLVEWQLRIACGEPLPLRADQLRLRGHAIEARIYAEDPARDFMPSVGVLRHLRQPTERPEVVRIDTGVAEGDRITPHYDPMIAKLIVWAEDRAGAVRRLSAALAEYEVVGVSTNLGLLRAIAAHPDYQAARLDTGFIASHAKDLMPASRKEAKAEDAVGLIAAALAVVNDERTKASTEAQASGDPWSPWSEADAWRMNGDGYQDLRLRREGGASVAVRVHPTKSDAMRIDVEDSSALASLHEQGESSLTVDGVKRRLRVIRSGAALTLVGGLVNLTYLRDDPLAPPRSEAAASELVTAPIPGRVTRILVKPGDQVEKNAPLMAIEAMKMEMTFRAPRGGVVSEVCFAVNQMVEEGSELVVFAA